MDKINFQISTDWHLGHKRIQEYCGRPNNFEALILKSHQEIPPDDILICLGDVAFGNQQVQHDTWVKKIPCRKWLIRGNHETQSNSFYLRNGWEFVTEWPLPLKVGNKTVLLSHFPATDEEMEFYGADLGVFGHEHNKGVRGFCDNRLCLAMEFTDYRPVELDMFVEKGYDYVDKL